MKLAIFAALSSLQTKDAAAIVMDMEKMIAKLNLLVVARDGAKTEVRLGLGAPAEEPDGTWSCEIDTPTVRKEPFKIYGGDSMQALCLASYLLREELLRLEKKGKLLFEAPSEDGQEVEFPLKAYFPSACKH